MCTLLLTNYEVTLTITYKCPPEVRLSAEDLTN
ncbi:hypothetical protein Pjdr2_1979 [Paenibacillus sp. JDR-2]|nr:hypothetical protein Pjdr2_1979 [Paenibacillus sp. JDR-2]